MYRLYFSTVFINIFISTQSNIIPYIHITVHLPEKKRNEREKKEMNTPHKVN